MIYDITLLISPDGSLRLVEALDALIGIVLLSLASLLVGRN
jgi:hypothetical protein